MTEGYKDDDGYHDYQEAEVPKWSYYNVKAETDNEKEKLHDAQPTKIHADVQLTNRGIAPVIITGKNRSSDGKQPVIVVPIVRDHWNSGNSWKSSRINMEFTRLSMGTSDRR
jgi:hypothetical protein